MENKYERGKIYKLINDEFPDLVYYGSTRGKLIDRLYDHRKTSGIRRCSSKILFEKGNCKIILVENYPCQSRKELLLKERYYIENNNCINKELPIITKEEHKQYQKNYRDTNKEQAKIQKKEWYEKNKDRINKAKREARKK